MKKVGRPYLENALRRSGKRCDFLLSKEDNHRLEVIVKVLEMTRSELIRKQIREIYKQLGVKENE